MICKQLESLTGIECMPLTPDGSAACLFLPIRYEDGDGMHIFIEQIGLDLVRFYDGGDVVSHFAGRGVDMTSHRRAAFIKNAAEPSGLVLNDDGELEIFVKKDQASQGFASFLQVLTRVRDWEVANIDQKNDAVVFLDEVEHLLRQAYPTKEVGPSLSFVGLTGNNHKLHFSVDGESVLAVQAHHAAISAAIKKMLDIKANPENSDLKTLVILDDRGASESLMSEAILFQTMGPVLDFSKLEEKARLSTTH